MLTVFATATIALALAAGASHTSQPPQETKKPDPRVFSVTQPSPEILAQFDFLEGEWDFTYTAKPPTGDGPTTTSQGKWTGRKRAGGGLIEDQWVTLGPDGQPGAGGVFTFRAYNKITQKWNYRSLNIAGGVWQEGVAERVGDEMHLTQWPPKEAAGAPMLRIRYYNIKPDRFSWVADASLDGGKTWTPEVARIEARRPSTASR